VRQETAQETASTLDGATREGRKNVDAKEDRLSVAAEDAEDEIDIGKAAESKSRRGTSIPCLPVNGK
jgi:hypothetical protein